MSGPGGPGAGPSAGTASRWLGEPPRIGLARAVRIAIVLAGLSPLLAALLRGTESFAGLALPLEAWFGFHCHRDPLRSLQVLGVALPVCMRCLGIYLGLALGALVLYPRLGPWALRIWLGVAVLAMLTDVWTEAWGLHAAHAGIRLITGLGLAYPVGATLVWAARDG